MTTPDRKLDSETERRPGVRWWPAVVILALAASRWGYIWFVQDGDRQANNLRTAFLLIVTTALLLLWVLLVSRLSWTLRLLILGGVVGIFGLSAALLEIRGVTGDLVPVVGWRWQSTPRSRTNRAKSRREKCLSREHRRTIIPKSTALTGTEYCLALDWRPTKTYSRRRNSGVNRLAEAGLVLRSWASMPSRWSNAAKQSW